jgi:ribonuclease E
VLRRLTESLARDRTRHQVSEVTSLGLVQLTRKRLGTGLVEAFSTPCPHCAGRGILLHGDPVDSTSATGRKSDAGGRRGKRGKKSGKADDVAVAKVPVHPAGEHPMFKAMAAANGRHEDDDEVEGEDTNVEGVAELEPDTIREAVVEDADEELEDEDFDESDEDESEDDDIDLDADDEDDDIDDDIEVINGDTDDEDSDEDEYDEDDDGSDGEDDDVDQDDAFETEPPVVTATAGRHRRRAAARPAGPPIHEG